MRAFFRSAVHRYRLVLPLAIVIAIGTFVPWPHFAQATPPSVLPPTPVIMKEAALTKQGVAISWLPAAVGQNPLTGYVIERSHDKAAFQEIGWAEPATIEYLDAFGRVGDMYRVRAHDTQKVFSVAPEPVAAFLAKLGTIQLTSEPVDTHLESAVPQTIPGIFIVFQEAVRVNNNDQAQAALTRLQLITYKVLNELPKSSPQVKQDAVNQCSFMLSELQTSTNLLPESLRIDGRIVIATCEAIQKAAV